MPTAQEEFKALRGQIQDVADQLSQSVAFAKGDGCTEAKDKGEVIANLMLAYRHLEDSRMRIGKAIQAYDGGESVYKD